MAPPLTSFILTSQEAVGVLDAKLNTVGLWANSTDTATSKSSDFDKGVVVYLNPSKQIVGVLLWNVHGQLDVARKLLKEKRTFEDVGQLARVFNVHA